MVNIVSSFLFMMIVNVLLYFVLGGLFTSDIQLETPLMTLGTIIIILLSVLISLLVYIANLLKEKL